MQFFFSRYVSIKNANSAKKNAIIPAATNALFHSKIAAVMLAMKMPRKPAAEKKRQIILALSVLVFSVMTFIKGPRSIESEKPRSTKHAKCTACTSVKGKNIADSPAMMSPVTIIFLGLKTSPAMPFMSWPTAYETKYDEESIPM